MRVFSAAGCGFMAIGLISITPASASSVLNVPANFPTIQAAIDASVNGDTVLVAPGTYFENVSFKGKLITVQSAQGPNVTTIDGGGLAPVVNFSTGETSAAVLQGFTLQHGNATFNYGYEGAGVHINSASPTVQDNVITANTACSGGGGISVAFASPTIRDNTITNNLFSCSGSSGGGIYVRGAASAQIIHNTISTNRADFGGGISLFAAGTPAVLNNTITNNTANNWGGGIEVVNQSDATIVQNLVTGNTSAQNGGGLYILTPSGTRGPLLVNNTVSGNSAPDSGVVLSGFDAQVQLFNNIVAAAATQPAVLCNTTYSTASPIFDHNDLFNSAGPATQGSCSLAVGANGNISADPRFVSASDYHLQATSPAIDAGNSSASSLPLNDLDGKPRISGTSVDQGVYEFQQVQPLAVTMSPVSGAVEGATFSATLAYFSGGVGPYSASVVWGDGQTSAGAIGAGNLVGGSHAYLEEGTYALTVTITDSTGATAHGTVSTSPIDAAITLAGTRSTVDAGSSFRVTVATLNDGDPNGTRTDYTGSISWGDGTTSTCPGASCSIVARTGGGFNVSGSHKYRRSGTYTITIRLADTGGSAASATTTIVANEQVDN